MTQRSVGEGRFENMGYNPCTVLRRMQNGSASLLDVLKIGRVNQ